MGVVVETGEPPEAESISKKVRERIDRADAFVGVFTRRSPIRPSGGRWRSAWRCVTGEAALWTAPPWVLQECGYALGRGLQTVLFVENGVDLGGLQGDLEYIPYYYSDPTSAITTASGMLNALLAAHMGASVETSVQLAGETAASRPESSVQPTERATDLQKPIPIAAEATSSDPLLAIVEAVARALHEHDFEQAEREFQSGLTAIQNAPSDDQAVGVSEPQWCFLYLEELKKAGGPKAFSRLRQLGDAYPEIPEISAAVARDFREYKDYDAAIQCYLRAAEASTGPKKQRYSLSAARCMNDAGQPADAAAFLIELLTDERETIAADLRSNMLAELSASLRKNGDHIAGLAVAEFGLKEDPTNARLRFGTGNEYDEAGYFELAARHFQMLSNADPLETAALHNLGLAYAHLNLPLMSVDCYTRAFELGETLSASNMAYKLIEVGFRDRCVALLDEASKMPDCDPRVAKCRGRLTQVAEAEEEKLSKASAKADSIKAAMLRISAGVLGRVDGSPEGVWAFPFCALTLTVSGTTIEGTGENVAFEPTLLDSLGGFASASTGQVSSRRGGSSVKHTWELAGRILGRLCKYTLRESKEGGLIFLPESESSGYLLIDPDGKRAELFRLKDGKLDDSSVIVVKTP